jgi:6-phosphogluconolactonase
MAGKELAGRRWLLLTCALVIPAAVRPAPLATPDQQSMPDKLWVYVGTYTDGGSKGIYRCELDLASGRLSAAALAGEAASPSFLAIHPSRRFLYAVAEVGEFRGKKEGGVLAFAIDPKTGGLTLLNQQASGGAGPCHLVVDREGRHVLAANYGGGSVCVLPIGGDGRLGEATAFVQHQGRGPDPRRQEAPHAHSVNLDAANRFAFVADLGLDQVLIYKFDAAKGTLTPNDPPAIALDPGAGPRHFAFHSDGRHAYVINEMHSTVTGLSYDPPRGALKLLQTVSTLPKGYSGRNSTAEVQVHPSGKFLYGSNRGHDSIAVFRVDKKTGELSAAGHQADGIKTPRNFGIDPTGAYLIAANQGADSLVAFRIDQQSGALTPAGSRVDVPRPVCVQMMPAK